MEVAAVYHICTEMYTIAVIYVSHSDAGKIQVARIEQHAVERKLR